MEGKEDLLLKNNPEPASPETGQQGEYVRVRRKTKVKQKKRVRVKIRDTSTSPQQQKQQHKERSPMQAVGKPTLIDTTIETHDGQLMRKNVYKVRLKYSVTSRVKKDKHE